MERSSCRRWLRARTISRNLRERARAGLEQAKKEGRVGGRRRKLSDHQQAEIVRMVSKGEKTAADAARLFKIHPATVSRLFAAATAVR
jgi:DNA invertase Pin-like site-specific DNA recombinase